ESAAASEAPAVPELESALESSSALAADSWLESAAASEAPAVPELESALESSSALALALDS
ncbi:hypothetical protein, partial [Stomatohabitans albus]|uniref:hypothetical protein n=1 Tax=Stomatohabitans albus TaxID=3110766 RepID=UPI00300C14A3